MERPGWSGSPSARATVIGTRSGSVIGARSTYHTPSPNSPASCGRDLDRQPGFAHPARTGQRHQPVLRQQLAHLGQLRVAANETGQLHRKMLGDNRFGYAQRRELVDQVGMAQLHHPLRAGQIAQRMGAQIGQPRVGGKPVDDQRFGRARQHGLAAVAQIAQPRGAVDGRAGVVAFVAQLDLAGSAPRSAAGSGPAAPAATAKRAGHRVGGAGERRHEAVALTLFDRAHPVMGGDGLRHRLIRAAPRRRSSRSGWVSHSRVEPSTSASSNVTVPVGNSPLTPSSLQSTSGASARGSMSLMLASMRHREPQNISENA